MRSRAVAASTAKAKFSELLHDVERGSEIIITRHGRPVAEIRPSQAAHSAGQPDALEEFIASVRKRWETPVDKPITTEEILQWRHEGHRY